MVLNNSHISQISLFFQYLLFSMKLYQLIFEKPLGVSEGILGNLIIFNKIIKLQYQVGIITRISPHLDTKKDLQNSLPIKY